jgi:hypothetical protein
MRDPRTKQEQLDFPHENISYRLHGPGDLRAGYQRFIHFQQQYVLAGPPMVPLLGGVFGFMGAELHLVR